MKLQGERFLGFHLFFLMLMNGKKEKDGFKIFMRGSSYGRTLLRSFASC